eukprot:UN05738
MIHNYTVKSSAPSSFSQNECFCNSPLKQVLQKCYNRFLGSHWGRRVWLSLELGIKYSYIYQFTLPIY